ncbi:hypothetical protein G7085_15895 [Tessaracoccus sp. HDW20]|uniref:hypothetical protein n=1 Tax=Tessaracoccus coleopterorum TaxID=2714950 RepID=UPI0018D3BFEB|nr:hypothetical protein [Tessaracoccus coleopterorum]NHB85579.1 hypothetical protein [Tessaracoccus coleopterorum]
MPPQLNIIQGGAQVAPPAGATAVDVELTGQSQADDAPADDANGGGTPWGSSPVALSWRSPPWACCCGSAPAAPALRRPLAVAEQPCRA